MKRFKTAALFISCGNVNGNGVQQQQKRIGEQAASSDNAPSRIAKVTLKFMTQSSPLAPADPNEKLILQAFGRKDGYSY